MDSYAMRLGNIIVGNTPNQAVIEMTVTGPTLRFDGETVFAVTGGDLAPTLNGSSIPMYRSTFAKSGDILEFGTVSQGLRGYIAFAGGITTPLQMGSRSTYLLGAIGGQAGTSLRDGNAIPIASLSLEQLSALVKQPPIPSEFIHPMSVSVTIRVILGPELHRFTKQAVNTFLNSEYKLTAESNRMGFRLDGERIDHTGSADIISAGLSRGAIQVPGHGLPIIMMCDRQTTGGYPRIANVISVDLPKLAQLKPGGTIRFEEVDVNQAHALISQEEKEIQNLYIRNNRVTDFEVFIDDRKYTINVERI